MSRLPVGYVVRIAAVRDVHTEFVECEYVDRQGEARIKCPVPHPYAGANGCGVFAGLEVGTKVVVALAPAERPYIIGIVPNASMYFDQSGVSNAPVFATEYPKIESGEIHIQSSVGSSVVLSDDGNVSIDANIGDSSADIELNNFAKAFFVRTDNVYRFTEAGREIEGVIKRDKSRLEDKEDTNTLNFLTEGVYSGILTDIGRSPQDDVQYRTTTISKSVTRNPALVEKRSIVYEYANSYGVRSLPFESGAMAKITARNLEESSNYTKINPSSRENRRTDVLDLNHRNFNHLIEKVEGTVVDIYGNVLDINRNIINVPEVEDIDTRNNSLTENGLRRAHAFLRRSIKYHFEINSRKDVRDSEPSYTNVGPHAKDHSRWSIDVDGEGLTKINIPASSETGNIPVLSRYAVSRNEEESKRDEGQFRDPDERDIRAIPFGAKDGSNFTGQSIVDSEYRPITLSGATVKVGTAHHNLFDTASLIIDSGKLRNPNPGQGAESVPVMVSDLNNRIPALAGGEYDPFSNDDANAGGRSVHANLDGSIELSVGADTSDRKSLMLDLAGGVVSHFGRDRNGRSVVHQTDGDVIIQIGGTGISDDSRFDRDIDTEDRPGRIEIHLKKPGGSQKVIIDENGISIDISGNGFIKTTGDFNLSAGGRLMLNGSRIFMYGSHDDSIDGDRSFKGGERLVARKGRHI